MFHVKRLILFLVFLPFVSCAQHMGTSSIEVKAFPPAPAKDESVQAYLSQFPETKTLSEREKDWFYWTNYSRVNPKRFWDSAVTPILKTFPNLKNSFTQSLQRDLYKSASLPMVKPNRSLARVAQQLASDLAAKKSNPSHTSPSGSTFEDRMQSIAVKKCAGENISFGPDNTLMMLVLLYIDEGVPDLGHRKTLLDPAFVEMGVGVGAYPDKKFMIVQDFACNQSE